MVRTGNTLIKWYWLALMVLALQLPFLPRWRGITCYWLVILTLGDMVPFALIFAVPGGIAAHRQYKTPPKWWQIRRRRR